MSLAEKLIAHRGWQRRYPENTLLGIEAAIAAGARHVELDLQLTADHIAVLFHDLSMKRMCDIDTDIVDLTFEQLADCSAHEPQRFRQQFLGNPISPLTDLVAIIKQHPQVTFYIEIKSESLNHFGHDIVHNAVLPHLQSAGQHCYVISFDLEILGLARDSGWPLIAPVLTGLDQLDTDNFCQLKPDMVFCNYKLLQQDTIETLFDYPVAVYEIDRYADVQLWLARGASLIETFAIGELIAADRGE